MRPSPATPSSRAAADARPAPLPSRPFVDPDPFRKLVYPSAIEAKRAIADLLGVPLGRLAAEERAAIDAILGETLERGSCWRASGRASRPRVREMAGAERGDGALRPGARRSMRPASSPTEHHRKVIRQMKAAIQAGRLVALSGLVGAGKTVLMRQLQDELAREGKVLVAKSLSVDKERVTLQTLMTALFFDLSPEKEPWIPSQGERRERELRNLIRKGQEACGPVRRRGA